MPRPTDALAIGLMSGTSVDGIDAVLAALAYHAGQLARVDVLACAHHPIPADLTAQIHALMLPGENEIDRAGAVHIQLAELYAAAARALIDRSSGEIAVIGCHGQTIRHRADAHPAFTWQLGCGATLAQRTRLPVVTDFRSADIACGGQGAPFAPALHRAIFASDTEHRAIVNLGGIANLTHLPSPGTGEVIGFDTGPANTLLDDWYRRHHPGGFDQAGAWAAQGRVSDPLLRFLLSDAYFSRAAPKSTGREMFNRHWLERKLDRFADRAGRDDLEPQDIQATLTALTAHSICDQVAALRPSVAAIYCYGGGVNNTALMQMLAQNSRARVHTTEALGLAPQQVEACTFAWLGHQTLNRIPSTLPAVTGAARATVAGALYFP